jgi:BirA family transcriptional regulator, biotin operon repressor / biotin---[acetyl-CoA-carboxylase] ligase
VGWPATDDDLPADLVGRATSLTQQLPSPPDREAVLAALLDQLDLRLGGLADGDGRAALADAFRRRCTTLGAQVRVELAERAFEGRAVALDESGHLVVATASSGGGVDGPAFETVVAGDVVHLRPAG